jgi:hypothetical protein
VFLDIIHLLFFYLEHNVSETGFCYVTTKGQSASLSWNKAPILGLRPDFYYCQTAAGLLMLVAVSDERTGLSFTIAAGLASAAILGPDPRGTRDHILLPEIRDFPFRCLLRLSGLRWRYSTPPPHGMTPELTQDRIYKSSTAQTIGES